MKSAVVSLIAVGLVGCVVACGGELAPGGQTQSDQSHPNPDPGGKSAGSGGGATSTGGGGTSGGGTTGTGSQTCTGALALDVPALRMCVPPALQFDDPLTLTLAVDETGITCVTCTATVGDGTIQLEIDGTQCAGDQSCNDDNATVTCALPALISGPYTLTFKHGRGIDQVPFDATSGAPTSCALAPPQPFDPASYDSSCMQDADCTLVADPINCNCECAGDVISTSSLAQYEADFARQHAECSEKTTDEPPCECPFLGTAACVNNVCTFKPANNGSSGG